MALSYAIEAEVNMSERSNRSVSSKSKKILRQEAIARSRKEAERQPSEHHQPIPDPDHYVCINTFDRVSVY